MTRWVCARDGTPLTGSRFDPWCPTCQGKTLAVEDGPITYPQYRAICDLFTSIGEINRAKRLRWISQAIGRPVSDFGELTTTEAGTAHTKLRKRVDGH